MFGSSILKDLFDNVLQTGIVKEIYHSVKLQQVDGNLKPVAPVKERFMYVGVDDRKGFHCYCRQTAPADVNDIEKIGGCSSNKYKLQIPHRLVFFNTHESRDHDAITGQLIRAVISSGHIRMQRVLNIPEDILRTEVPTGRFSFKEQTFYVAIDFFVLLDLVGQNCNTELNCADTKNPYC